jgi:hypothetical protein
VPVTRVQTRWFDLEYLDGIFYLRVKPGAVIDVAEFEDYVVAAEEMLADEFPVPYLVDVGKINSSTPASRRLIVQPRYARLCSRCALLVQNPVARVIGSVFLGISNPPYESRLFGDEVAATKWLRELLP